MTETERLFYLSCMAQFEQRLAKLEAEIDAGEEILFASPFRPGHTPQSREFIAYGFEWLESKRVERREVENRFDFCLAQLQSARALTAD